MEMSKKEEKQLELAVAFLVDFMVTRSREKR